VGTYLVEYYRRHRVRLLESPSVSSKRVAGTHGSRASRRCGHWPDPRELAVFAFVAKTAGAEPPSIGWCSLLFAGLAVAVKFSRARQPGAQSQLSRIFGTDAAAFAAGGHFSAGWHFPCSCWRDSAICSGWPVELRAKLESFASTRPGNRLVFLSAVESASCFVAPVAPVGASHAAAGGEPAWAC